MAREHGNYMSLLFIFFHINSILLNYIVNLLRNAMKSTVINKLTFLRFTVEKLLREFFFLFFFSILLQVLGVLAVGILSHLKFALHDSPFLFYALFFHIELYYRAHYSILYSCIMDNKFYLCRYYLLHWMFYYG